MVTDKVLSSSERDEIGFGRLIQPDVRNQRYLARILLTGEEVFTPLEELGNPAHPGTRNWWDNGGWHQQGNTGQCVGFGTANWIEDSTVTHPDFDPDGHKIYCACCKRDAWSANDGCDVQFGTSVLASGLWMREVGIVKEFRWAENDADAAYRWLLTRGPLLVGFTFYNSMFRMRRERDAQGNYRYFMVVDPSEGGADQGHCFQINGINVHAGTVRAKLGSWSREFYNNGRVQMHMRDFEMLMRDYGEVMMAMEIKGQAEEDA
jgi:hypothetical protein